MVNNWRTEHSYPLNVYQGTLRNRSRLIDSHGFVSQRIKRLAAIEDKLQRFPHMELSRMQDLADVEAFSARLMVSISCATVTKKAPMSR